MSKVYNPQDFGAVSGAGNMNTQAIQAALDAAAQDKAQERDNLSEVVLGAGLWESGPLRLPSNVVLRLDKDAVLKAADPQQFVAAYIGDAVRPNEALLQAHEAENITICGEGVIDGSGALWWSEAEKLRQALRSGNTAEFEKRFPGVKLANGMPRPWLLELSSVKNVKLSGVTLRDSPMWTLVIRNSQDVEIDGIQVQAPVTSPNTDGIDIVSSQHITIRNTKIVTGDDNIAIKSGVEQNGALPSEDILIEDSEIYAGHGVSVGSETANGIGSITINNVKFFETENGVRIKSARDRGNQIGPVHVTNVQMEKVETPILVTCSYAGQSGVTGMSLVTPIDPEEPCATTPYIKELVVKDLVATEAKYAAVFSGLPESPLMYMILDGCNIQSQYGIQARYVVGTLINLNLKVQEGERIAYGPKAMLKEAR